MNIVNNTTAKSMETSTFSFSYISHTKTTDMC